MGIIKRGILGGFSGKVANVVGTSWKGRAVMKSLPLSVANPKTTKQVNQRTKFGVITKFAASITTSWIQPLWNRFSGDISGFNNFIKQNIDIVSTSGNIGFSSMIASFGELSNGGLEINFIGTDGDVQSTWNTDLDGNMAATDVFYCMVVNETTDEVIGISNTAVRSAGYVNIPLSEDVSTGGVYRVIYCFASADGSLVSDSMNQTLDVS